MIPQRILDKIEVDDSGCWLWTAADNGKGYGVVYYGGRQAYAHRVMYELLVDKIPDGLTIDHLCKVRNCVNPQHLEPVTIRENVQRGERAQQTHCINGHEFTEDNTRIRSNGTRKCKTCDSRIGREHRARKRNTKTPTST